jgi:hypothetical protein
MDSLFDIILFGVLKGYLIYLEIHSANYKMKLINSNNKSGIVLRIGKCHSIFIGLFKNFRVSFFNKLTLCFYTNQLFHLKNELYSLTLKKKRGIYKKKGTF